MCYWGAVGEEIWVGWEKCEERGKIIGIACYQFRVVYKCQILSKYLRVNGYISNGTVICWAKAQKGIFDPFSLMRKENTKILNQKKMREIINIMILSCFFQWHLFFFFIIILICFTWANGLSKIVSLSLRVRCKVCVHYILLKPHYLMKLHWIQMLLL